MIVTPLAISDVLLIEPTVFGDERGYFLESFNQRRFNELIGREVNFVQDNHSLSAQNVLRGLHYQIKHAQGKLVRVTSGAVFDVAVDLRKYSPTYGKWVGHVLSAENKRQMWIPEGFAHGFLVLSHAAEFLYKTTDYWSADHERCIGWNDKTLAIDWPLQGNPIVSKKDSLGTAFLVAESFDTQFDTSATNSIAAVGDEQWRVSRLRSPELKQELSPVALCS